MYRCVLRRDAEVPELTARVARAANPKGTTAMWVRDRLEGLWSDEDFAGWHPRERRPALSPAQLARACVLQFLRNLSDRQAPEAVRCRIDFKYALVRHEAPLSRARVRDPCRCSVAAGQ